MAINYMIRFKTGAPNRVLYLLASTMFTWPILNLGKVLRISFFHSYLVLNATPTTRPTKATTRTTPTTSINTTTTTASTPTTLTNNYSNYSK